MLEHRLALQKYWENHRLLICFSLFPHGCLAKCVPCMTGNLDRNEASSNPSIRLSSTTVRFSAALESALCGIIPDDCALVGRLAWFPGKDEINRVILTSTTVENSRDTLCMHGRADILGTQKTSTNMSINVNVMLPRRMPYRTRSPLMALRRVVSLEDLAIIGMAVMAKKVYVACASSV
jgi:hypothetical protein